MGRTDSIGDAVDNAATASEVGELEGTVAPEESSAPDAAQMEEVPDSIWEDIQNAVLANVQREQFETWFRRASLRSVRPEQVVIAVQNGFTRDWLLSYYRDVLVAAIRTVLGGTPELVVEVDPELCVRRAPQQEVPRTESPSAPVGSGAPAGSGAGPSERPLCGVSQLGSLRIVARCQG